MWGKWGFFLLLIFIGIGYRGVKGCLESILLDTADSMVQQFCDLYSESRLDAFNGFVLGNNASITYRLYDYVNRRCGDPQQVPLNYYLPLVFRMDHTCNAAIPMMSSRGTDSSITLTGYGEFQARGSTKVKEITFIFTEATISVCALKLQSMEMKDLECIDSTFTVTFPTDSGLTGTSTGTGSPTSDTSNSSGTTSDTSISSVTISDTSNSSGTICTSSSNGRPEVQSIRYPQDLPQYEDSFALQQQVQLQECPYKISNLRIVKTKVPYAQSNLACFKAGYRAADITKANIKDALTLVESCLGLGESVWIGRYWNPVRRGSCLELASGNRSRTGGISLMKDCTRAQSVLCEDPFFKT